MIKQIHGALLAAMLLGAGTWAAESAPASTAQEAPKAASFQFTDTHGQRFRIVENPKGLAYPDFKGKKVLAMFFIYSGTPCRNELQLFSRLRSKFPDLEFVAFELKGLKPDQLAAFEKELKLQGIHLVDTAQAMPFAQYIAQRARWQGSVPLIIVSDAKGEVKHMQLGAMNEEELQKLYSSL